MTSQVLTPKENNTQESPKKNEALPPWVALVFFPGKLIKSQQDTLDSDITGLNPVMRQRVGQYFQTLIEPKDYEPGMAYQTFQFFIHPGTNLGYHTRQSDDTEIVSFLPTKVWESVKKNPINAKLIQTAIGEIYPDPNLLDNGEEPAYRHFSTNNALMLVEAHFHENWVNRAMIGENRTEIQLAANRQIEIILEHRRRLVNGN